MQATTPTILNDDTLSIVLGHICTPLLAYRRVSRQFSRVVEQVLAQQERDISLHPDALMAPADAPTIMPSLRSLEIEQLAICTDHSIASAALSRRTALRTLSLVHFNDGASVRQSVAICADQFVSQLTDLRALDMSASWFHTSADALARLTLLTRLEQSGRADNSAQTDAFSRLGNLRHLELGMHLRRIMSTSWTIATPLAYLTALQRLGFPCTMGNDVTNDVLATLANSAQQLTRLACSDCRLLQPGAFASLTQLCELSVKRSPSLTDAAFACMPRLRSIEVSWCERVTGAAFRPELMPQLRQLGASGCDELAAHAVAALTQVCELNVSNCRNMTSAALAPLTQLEQLDVTQCRCVSALVLSKLSRLTVLAINDLECLSPHLRRNAWPALHTLHTPVCFFASHEDIERYAQSLQ